MDIGHCYRHVIKYKINTTESPTKINKIPKCKK